MKRCCRWTESQIAFSDIKSAPWNRTSLRNCWIHDLFGDLRIRAKLFTVRTPHRAFSRFVLVNSGIIPNAPFFRLHLSHRPISSHLANFGHLVESESAQDEPLGDGVRQTDEGSAEGLRGVPPATIAQGQELGRGVISARMLVEQKARGRNRPGPTYEQFKMSRRTAFGSQAG
jgi:hypothetical protein